MSRPDTDAELQEIVTSLKRLAQRYQAITGRPIGITGEVVEYEAARLLGLEPAPVRSPGYDLVRTVGDRRERLQLKSRVLRERRPIGRIGSIDPDGEWDAALLLLMDAHFEPFAIYEASRPDILAALTRPGSKARNERHARASRGSSPWANCCGERCRARRRRLRSGY